MARSVLEIILSLKGDKATRELKKVDKELGKVDKSATKSVGAIKKFDTKLALLAGGAGVAAAGVVKLGQAIWALGKRGAVVEQTGESFDFLLKKLSVAPDLLEDLRKESLGTVDDMTLMSSTMTLVAGTSDELARALLEATPELLKIAKATNKLNPAMGDTAFQFESITAGIKRNSKLVLDNLGIVFSSEQAYKNYAESLGKTADQLTENEKVLATLQAALVSGGNLVDQVGGDVAAAGDDIARAEVKIQGLKDEWALLIEGPVAATASALTDAISGINDTIAAIRGLDGAYKDGIITLEEWTAVRLKQQRSEWDNIKVMEWLTEKTKEAERANWNLRIQFEHTTSRAHLAGDAYNYYSGELEDTAEASDEAGRSTEELAKRMDSLNEKSAEAIKTLRGMTDIKIKDFFDVDLGIGDVAARMFDITQFKEFGGEALEIMVKEVQAGLVQGKITNDQAREFFKNIAVEAEAIKVQMGEISAADAAESIAEDFNVPIAESRELIDGVLEGIDLVNSADISAITEEFDALQERKEMLIEAGEIPIEADPQDEAQQVLDGLQEQVDILTAEPWIIEFQIVTTGEIPTGGGGTVTISEGPDFQHGGSFVVPSGYTRVGLPINVHTGEHVMVRPKGQVGEPSVVNNYLYNTQYFNDEGAAALGLAVVRKFGRDRLNASMGR